MSNNIFEDTGYLNPAYQHFDKYVLIMFRSFWTPAKYEKLIRDQDVPHFFNETGPIDQQAITRCLMATATVEDKVKMYWNTACLDFPQTIISDVGGVFGLSETVHRRSYHALLEDLDVDLGQIKDHPALQGRLDYLGKYIERDRRLTGKKHVLKKLVLFTALVERASLFTQFYILMSYAYRNRGFKTISALQQSTATEELVHYSFGLDMINTIKSESPHLWSDYLVELVEKNIQLAYDSELALIDWFFEEGVPEHLSKKEVINFLNYNFSVIANDLELDLQFDYDVDYYQEHNSWMLAKVKTTAEPDFFDNATGGYASEDEEIDIDNFEF